MNTRTFAVLAAVLLAASVVGQSPGGVSTNLRGWYDASSGLTVAGTAVSQWNDRSGNALHATQSTNADKPANTGLINYNTALVFDGASDHMDLPDQVPAVSTGLTVFAVARQTSTSGDPYGTVILGQSSNTGSGGGYGLTSQAIGNTSFGFFLRDFGTQSVGFATTLSRPAMMTGNWNGTTANTIQYFQDGTSRGTLGYTPGSVGDGGPSYIGSGDGAGTNYCFAGQIAEIAVYSSGLSLANVNKVESYMSLKYGVTLSTNYVNSAGTTLFTTASPYNNNIIGIGRDDGSGLNQKQSQNFDDSVRVFIGTLAASNAANATTFSSSQQFVVLGANTGRMRGVTSEQPSGMYSRIEREWKVTNTGFTGTFAFSIKLSAGATPGSVNVAHLRLLVDDDGDFSNATVINGGVSFAYSNPLITVSGIDNSLIPANSTKYITIGSAVASTPLPIELVGLEALMCNQRACIRWKTAVESNTDHFEIERSADAINWESIGNADPKGQQATYNEYEFFDPAPLKGLSYYRIKELSTYGAEQTSPSVWLDNRFTPTERLFFPNPVQDYLFESSGEWPEVMQLFDMTGRDVTAMISKRKILDRSALDLSMLPEGVYFLRYGNGGDSSLLAQRLSVKR